MSVKQSWVVMLLMTACGPCQDAIAVGPGFTDVSPRQLARSLAGTLYIVIPTCDRFPDCPGARLRAYRGTEAPGAKGYLLLDPQHAPGDGAGSTAIAQDADGRIRVLWNTRDGRARTATIDTATDRWSDVTDLEPTDWTDFGQGDQGVALAVDAAGRSHAVWNRRIEGHLRIRYAMLDRAMPDGAAAWSAPVTIDDVAPGDRRNAWHPTLAFAPDGSLWLSWLEGSTNYVGDGIIRVRMRAPDGGWAPSEAIPDAAMTAIDNGPSMLVTGDGVAHLSFVDTGNIVKYWYHDAAGWHGDRQPPSTRTHNPALGPDGEGGVRLYAHGTVPEGDLAGHGDDLFVMRLAAGRDAWGRWTRIAKGSLDCSVAVRWAQFHEPWPGLLDWAFWNDAYPNDLWVGTDTP